MVYLKSYNWNLQLYMSDDAGATIWFTALPIVS